MESVVALEGDPNAARLAKIAKLVGAPFKVVSAIPNRPSALILSGRDFENRRGDLEGSSHRLLVYGADGSGYLVKRLGSLAPPAAIMRVTRSRPEITLALSGLSVGSASVPRAFAPASGATSLAAVGECPFFVQVDARLLALSTATVLDLDERVDPAQSPWRTRFAELMPFAMYMRWAMGERCWRPAYPVASIVIDDPLLIRRYGCITYSKLLDWLKEQDLAATLAFIPWNCERSDPRIATLFRKNPERLSICVHGCDHLAGEFAIGDRSQLSRLVRTASARMARHRALHDLPYDPVMVFPQGRFSSEALEALASSGYAAAVNTSLFPEQGASTRSILELLDLAVTGPQSVPLFGRRYPGDLFDFGCDMFFGKPTFVVQHHQDFRDGYDSLQSFTEELRQIEPDLLWLPLGAAIRSSYWQRADTHEGIETRIVSGEGAIDEPSLGGSSRFGDRARVALRRHASEARDNYVHRSRPLTAALDVVKGRLQG